jgi:D-glycerate 3-kinase
MNGKPAPEVLAALMALTDEARAAETARPVVIGVCGAQGSGKSTLARAALRASTDRDIPAAILSLDDLYLTRAQRQDLARKVHPLFSTRGVPGTHDTGLGLEVLHSLKEGECAPLPRFDKAADDRAPQKTGPNAPERCQVLFLEGWCVGARPQLASDLIAPVNALEAAEDPDGCWRGYANDMLAGPYQELFGLVHRLVLLAAPGFEVVEGWRAQQERELAGATPGKAVMDPAGIARFVQFYERLTRHILKEMPERADLVISFDKARRPLSIQRR